MLKIALKRSGRLLWVLLAAHAGAIGLLWPIALSPWIKAGIALAIAASFVHYLRHTVLLSTPGSIVAVEITDQSIMSFQTADGQWHECSLSGDTYVSPWLTILVLKLKSARFPRYAVITGDNIDGEDFRRLRVWLRWARVHRVEPSLPP